MSNDLLAWTFHSPKRLLGVTAGVLLAVTVVVTGMSHAVGGGAGRGASEAPATVASAAPTPSAANAPALGSPGSSILAPVPDVVATQVARKFVKAWLAGPSATTPKAWLTGMAPYVTGELYAGLAQADPARVPAGKISIVPASARAVGEFVNELTVPLVKGPGIDVTLAYDGTSWRVTEVEESSGP